MKELLSLLGVLLLLLIALYWQNGKIKDLTLELHTSKQEVISLQLQVEKLQQLAKTTETLLNSKCEKEVETEKVVTRTITKIKETPYEVPTTPESQLPESLVRLLDEAYGDLHLRQAP